MSREDAGTADHRMARTRSLHACAPETSAHLKRCFASHYSPLCDFAARYVRQEFAGRGARSGSVRRSVGAPSELVRTRLGTRVPVRRGTQPRVEPSPAPIDRTRLGARRSDRRRARAPSATGGRGRDPRARRPPRTTRCGARITAGTLPARDASPLARTNAPRGDRVRDGDLGQGRRDSARARTPRDPRSRRVTAGSCFASALAVAGP